MAATRESEIVSDSISIESFRKNMRDVIGRVEYSNEILEVQRRDKPVAMLIPLKIYDMVHEYIAEKLEEHEDARLSAIAFEVMENDEFSDWDEFKKEL